MELPYGVKEMGQEEAKREIRISKFKAVSLHCISEFDGKVTYPSFTQDNRHV